MSIDNKLVGAAITQLRVRAGMTQLQLASALNVSHQAVSKWEKGAALPDIQTLLALTQMFGVSMEQLLSGNIGEEEPEKNVREETEEENDETGAFAKWFSGAISPEAIGNIQKTADSVKQSVMQFGENLYEKAGEAIEMAQRAFSHETGEPIETDFSDESAPGEATEEARSKDTMTFEQLIAMAPYLSKEKLIEIAMELKEVENPENLCRIAPFLPKATVEAILLKAIEKEEGSVILDKKMLIKLAPFLRTQALFRIIVKNLHLIDWDTMRRLAPFLKAQMVDQLTDFLRFGKVPASDNTCDQNGKKSSFSSGIQSAINDIGNLVSEVSAAVTNAFRPQEAAEGCEESAPKEAPVSDKQPNEFKDKVARAALESGSWSWIDKHLNEVGDQVLILEIAVKALELGDPSSIAVRAAKLMNADSLPALFDAIIEKEAWDAAIALRDLADEGVSGRILEKAANATEARRESAYQAIEFYAAKAPRDVLEKITERAVREDNWVLIGALTDAL